MFDTDDVDEAKRMLPIYKRAVDLLETVSGKKTEQAEQSSEAATPTKLAEPVATVVQSRPDTAVIDVHAGNAPLQLGTKLYAAPVRTKDPCHPWQDLTDEEIEDIPCGNIFRFARAVIAAYKEKNK